MTRMPGNPPGDDRRDDDLSRAEVESRWLELTSQLGDFASTVPTAPAEPAERPVGPVPGRGPRDYEVEDDDGAFVPPEADVDLDPSALSAGFRLGWFLVILGILATIVVFFTRGPAWIAIIGTLVTAGGILTLAMALPERQGDDDNNGAVV
ncbi:MAG TPA: hypothetical protein VFC82_08450 [Actinomycetaceae bacterium]|nr:hypothetical protein [Actinomycetaceae bacterium]